MARAARDGDFEGQQELNNLTSKKFISASPQQDGAHVFIGILGSTEDAAEKRGIHPTLPASVQKVIKLTGFDPNQKRPQIGPENQRLEFPGQGDFLD